MKTQWYNCMTLWVFIYSYLYEIVLPGICTGMSLCVIVFRPFVVFLSKCP